MASLGNPDKPETENPPLIPLPEAGRTLPQTIHKRAPQRENRTIEFSKNDPLGDYRPKSRSIGTRRADARAMISMSRTSRSRLSIRAKAERSSKTPRICSFATKASWLIGTRAAYRSLRMVGPMAFLGARLGTGAVCDIHTLTIADCALSKV